MEDLGDALGSTMAAMAASVCRLRCGRCQFWPHQPAPLTAMRARERPWSLRSYAPLRWSVTCPPFTTHASPSLSCLRISSQLYTLEAQLSDTSLGTKIRRAKTMSEKMEMLETSMEKITVDLKALT